MDLNPLATAKKLYRDIAKHERLAQEKALKLGKTILSLTESEFREYAEFTGQKIEE